MKARKDFFSLSLNQVFKAVAADKPPSLRSRWLGQLQRLPSQSGGAEQRETLPLSVPMKTGKKDKLSIRPLGRPSHDFFALPSSTPTPSLTTLLPLLPLPLRGKTHGPLTWATVPGSFVVHHHKDLVHAECLSFIHN